MKHWSYLSFCQTLSLTRFAYILIFNHLVSISSQEKDAKKLSLTKGWMWVTLKRRHVTFEIFIIWHTYLKELHKIIGQFDGLLVTAELIKHYIQSMMHLFLWQSIYADFTVYLATESCLQINLSEKSALIVIPAMTASDSSNNSDPFHENKGCLQFMLHSHLRALLLPIQFRTCFLQ